MKNKELKKIDYYLNQKQLDTIVTFDDDTTVYIFIQPGMIFVADCNYTELCKRIDNDDTESFESYDTVDGCDYYSKSEYAEYINCALLYLSNRLL